MKILTHGGVYWHFSTCEFDNTGFLCTFWWMLQSELNIGSKDSLGFEDGIEERRNKKSSDFIDGVNNRFYAFLWVFNGTLDMNGRKTINRVMNIVDNVEKYRINIAIQNSIEANIEISMETPNKKMKRQKKP